MLAGVSIEDPDTTYIAPGVEIGADTVIKPNTHLLGSTKVGEDCIIGPDCYIEDSIIESGSKLQFTQVINKK